MTTASINRRRVGRISFLNCYPLEWGLQRAMPDWWTDSVVDTPDALSDSLVAGDLEIAPISVIEAMRHSRDLLVLPEVAVGAAGPVQSVVLVSRRPLAALDGGSVALSSTSRTSVALARLLLEQREGVRPSYVVAAPDPAAMLREHDAAVLIGDPALDLVLRGAPAGVEIWDLAQEWRDWTDLPFVFAVWAVRTEAVAGDPAWVGGVRRDLRDALNRARQCSSEVAADAAAHSHHAPDQLARYFAGLDFGLSDQALRGVEEFRHRCADGLGERGLSPLTLLATL